MKPSIKIDVVSDVVCPWCYIGKRRLEKAISQLKDRIDVEVEYHPFELNPATPKEGINHKAYLVNKFGGEARYRQLTDHVVGVAAGEGLKFNFDDHHITPNTLDAHRLIAFARQHGKQHEMKEALMSAYFEKGRDLTQANNLVDEAVSVGLDRSAVEVFLKSDALLAEVKLEEQHSLKRGVSGVPFYIINDKYGISGAQPTEAFVQVLTEIGGELGNTTAESCDVESKEC